MLSGIYKISYIPTKKLNCGEPLKRVKRQRSLEIGKHDRGESRKSLLDSIWLNPKYCDNGQSAAKTQIE